MAQHDKLEQYERTEAQEIIRLLQAMQPQQEAQAPADFRVKVLRKVAERQAHRWGFAWLSGLMTPAWAPAVALGFLLRIERGEWLALVLTIVLVLAAEGVNTAVEAAVDLASPAYHPLAKVAKDVAAGTVLLTAIGAVIVGLILFLPYLLILLN